MCMHAIGMSGATNAATNMPPPALLPRTGSRFHDLIHTIFNGHLSRFRYIEGRVCPDLGHFVSQEVEEQVATEERVAASKHTRKLTPSKEQHIEQLQQHQSAEDYLSTYGSSQESFSRDEMKHERGRAQQSLMDGVPLAVCVVSAGLDILRRNAMFEDRFRGGDCEAVLNLLQVISTPEDRQAFVEEVLKLQLAPEGLGSKADYSTSCLKDREPTVKACAWSIRASVDHTFVVTCSDVPTTYLDRMTSDYFLRLAASGEDQNIISDLASSVEDFKCIDTIVSRRMDDHSTSVLAFKAISGSPISNSKRLPPNVFARNVSTRSRNQIKAAFSSVAKKSKFSVVRMVNHEIRSPLSAVISGLDFVLDENRAGKDITEVVGELKGACAAATDVLDDLLVYELTESNAIVLQRQPCNLIQSLQSAVDLFASDARHSEICIAIDSSVKSTAVFSADAVRIQQVFRSLISNAFKYTPKRGTVTVVVSSCAAPNRVRVEFRDSGSGLTVAERTLLFKHHENVDFKDLHASQGRGLGMHLARHFINLHSGCIGVDMDWAGQGSKFYIELPVLGKLEVMACVEGVSTTTDQPIVRKYLTAEEIVNPAQYNLRLLLVDDVSLVRKFHRRILDPYCNECVEALNGKEAILRVVESIAARKPFDAILMDNSMPVMNGDVATAAIRELGYTGKIFGVTGNVLQVDLDAFKAHGCTEVLMKPLSITQYAHIVKSVQCTFRNSIVLSDNRRSLGGGISG